MNRQSSLNYTVQRVTTYNEESSKVKYLRIGDIPKTETSPDEYYIIEKNNQVCFLLKAYHRQWGFSECLIWNQYLAVGFSTFFYLIELENNHIICIDFGDQYFGHIYTSNHYIWVSSMNDLLCMDIHGKILWRLDGIAVDGICINDFDGKYLRIDCELDPPGGWVSYRVNNTIGKIEIE